MIRVHQAAATSFLAAVLFASPLSVRESIPPESQGREKAMAHDSIHRAVSDDGTEIVARVRGTGPPLVLVHGGLGDSESSWNALVPFLENDFTCYIMSTRGRGLSAEPLTSDYSMDRLVEDVVAMAESVGESVGLVGHSLGAALSLGAAAHSEVIRGVAVYEPAVLEVQAGRTDPVFVEAVGAMIAAAAEGRFEEAALALIDPFMHEDEHAALADVGVSQAWARNVPVAMQEIQQAENRERPGPTSSSSLEQVEVPVMYLLGSRAHAWHRDGARYLSENLDDIRVVEIDGAGHFGPQVLPEPVAEALIDFFSTAPSP